MRILAIDDSATVLRFISISLSTEDTEVITEQDAILALKRIPEVKPDLITVDIEMPEISGFDFCERVRSGELDHGGHYYSRIPIVVITSTDTEKVRQRGFQAGVDDLILKPFYPAELKKTIQRILYPEKELSTLNVLVVDDSSTIRKVVKKSLESLGLTLEFAEDGEIALNTLNTSMQTFDLILTDLDMPNMNGLELCREIRKIACYQAIPIIFLTAMGQEEKVLEAFKLGATDYLLKPFTQEILLARLQVHFELRLERKHKEQKQRDLEKKVFLQNKELHKVQESTIHMLASLAESHDPETSFHTKRTQTFVQLILEKLKNTERYKGKLDLVWCDNLIKSSPLHDIGKVGVPDRILKKKGPLTEEEFEVMKKHAEFGGRTLMAAQDDSGAENFMEAASEVAFFHHEKWDGKGYPKGLEGEKIPLAGRIMAIADVYDALTQKRVYKDAMSHEKAMVILLEGSGKHFDPYLIDVLSSIEGKFDEIRAKFQD